MAKDSPLALGIARLIAKHIKNIQIPNKPVPKPKTPKKKGTKKAATKLVGPAIKAVGRRVVKTL